MGKGKFSGRIFIGTSGWNYRHWSDGVFYPQKLKQPMWLQYYCQFFDPVEINNTFYRLPDKTVFEKWYSETPKNFMFAVKASRFITHMKKLREPDNHVARFLENVKTLQHKLRIVLFQLPPSWNFNEQRLQGFCEYLCGQSQIPHLRSALEVRHPSWLCESCFKILNKFNIALALTDWPGCSVRGPINTDHIFIRRHGPSSLYSSKYSLRDLEKDAYQIHSWRSKCKSVHFYFNNDANGFAPANAITLKRLLNKPTL